MPVRQLIDPGLLAYTSSAVPAFQAPSKLSPYYAPAYEDRLLSNAGKGFGRTRVVGVKGFLQIACFISALVLNRENIDLGCVYRRSYQ